MQNKSSADTHLPIAIDPEDWQELLRILHQRTGERRVWAFGSRATGQRMRRYSDLDLMIGTPALTFEELDQLREDLDESLLEFKVDLVQLDEITPEFRARIEPDLVLIQG